MTVASSVASHTYAADGSNKAWPFTFGVYAATQVELSVYDPVDRSTSAIAQADYDVALNADGSGTVTYPKSGAALAAPLKVVVRRALPRVQERRIGNQGAFYPQTHEAAFDYATRLIQDVGERADRALVVEAGSGEDPASLLAQLRLATGLTTMLSAVNINYLPDDGNAVARTVKSFMDEVRTLRSFGCAGDSRILSGLSTTAGSAALTGPADTFLPSDVGKLVHVYGADAPSGGGTQSTVLIATVAAYVSGTQVTLSRAAGATVATTADYAIPGFIGTDDRESLEAAAAWLAAAPGRKLSSGPGCFLIGGHPDVEEHSVYFTGSGYACDFVGGTFLGNLVFGRSGAGNKVLDAMVLGGRYVVLGDPNKDGIGGSVNWNSLNVVHAKGLQFIGIRCDALGGGARCMSIQTDTDIANTAGVANIEAVSVVGFLMTGPGDPTNGVLTSGIDVLSAGRGGLVKDVTLANGELRDLGLPLYVSSGNPALYRNTGLNLSGVTLTRCWSAGAVFTGHDRCKVRGLTVAGLRADGTYADKGRGLIVSGCHLSDFDDVVVEGDDVAGLAAAIVVSEAVSGDVVAFGRVTARGHASNKFGIGIWHLHDNSSFGNLLLENCTTGIDVSGFKNVFGPVLCRGVTTPVDTPNLANNTWAGNVLTYEVGQAAKLWYGDTGDRAWVSFNGLTGTMLAAFNVAGVVRNAAGDYTVNILRPLEDGFAPVSGMARTYSGLYPFVALHGFPAADSVRVLVVSPTTGALMDTDFVCVRVGGQV